MMAKHAISISIALSALILAARVGAQEPAAPDPVVVHFREYRAALERQDFPAAETAAEAALAASETASGARTAVLALNLAALRLELGRPADAYAPAQRAHELATEASGSGVDPLLASLTLGRAELAVSAAAGRERLTPAIAAAESRPDFRDEAYEAAGELGRWAFEAQDYETAQVAYAAAGRLADAAPMDRPLALGLARTGEGVSVLLGGIGRQSPEISRSSRPTLDADDARAADAALTEAQELLRPLAAQESPTGNLTVAQSAYAFANAWQGALLAKLESQDEELPRSASGAADGAQGAAPLCEFRIVAEPEPELGPEALDPAGVAAVVMKIKVGNEGEILGREIAAAVPSGLFGGMVAAVADQWQIERQPGSPPGCRVEGTRYLQVRFVPD